MIDANQMLRAYAAERSEEAFRTLVERCLPLVYSTALRLVQGDVALAQDVSQMVFCDLARKARSLPANVVLSGWLYRHTTFTAAKALRTEARRRAREREAVVMNAGDDNHSWDQVVPLLDDAISSLSASDRDAVMLRFFDKQDFRTLGVTLRLSEDAAQKRVSRALEKLRRYFERRGVPVSSATLAGLMATQVAGAAPAALAGAIAGNAVAQLGATATPLLISILMGKIKTIAVGAVVVAAVTTPLVFQHKSISRLRAENQRLVEQAAVATETPTSVATNPPDNRELLQLRAEVARLRREQSKVAQLEAENKMLRTANRVEPPAPAAEEPVPSESWADRGFASPMDTLQTAHWAIRTANIEKFRESLFITDEARQRLHDLIAKMAAKAPPGEAAKVLEEVAKRGWDAEEGLLFPMIAQNQKHGYKSYRVLTETVTRPDEQQITIELQMNTAPAQTRQFRFKQFGDAWKQVIDVADLPREARQ